MSIFILFFFFKQKTAYEILTCDWSSDVCSSDLITGYPVLFVVVADLHSNNVSTYQKILRL